MIHPCLIPNGQVIIFNFPAGAGGKMLQNCVGLSRHCVLNKLEYAQWQLSYSETVTDAFYQQKFNWIILTIPPQTRINDWLGYEFDEQSLYGINFTDFNNAKPVQNNIVYQLPEKQLWSTITAHNFESTMNHAHYWHTIKHVSLVNSKKFGRHSLALKNPNLQFDQTWDTLGCAPKGLSFEFDIDNTIYNSNRFVDQVKLLYEYLRFDDCPYEHIEEYHRRYIKLHI
jgi:hypothetical protein